MQARLHSVDILDMLPSSDCVPLSVVFNFNSTLVFIDSSTCPSNKVNFNWTKATDKDLLDYSYLTSIYCKNIHDIDVVTVIDDVNCKSHEHV